MRSMTGFGSGSASGDAGRITVQIAAVNHRQARVQVRGELRDPALEEGVRQRVQEVLRRGSVNVQVGLQVAAEQELDLQRLEASWKALAASAAELGAPTPRLELVARLLGGRPAPAAEELAPLLEAALDAALADCQAMRRREGEALATVLGEQRRRLLALREELSARAAGRVDRQRQRLEERLGELLRERGVADEAALLRELALYADRIDITEELDRLHSHLEQLGELLAQDEGQGKKMEFLLQEIGREINTTGSKAADAGLQHLVVEAKAVLEQMKEQVANVL